MAKKKMDKKSLRARLDQVWKDFLDYAESNDDAPGSGGLPDVREKLNEWLDEWHGEDYFGTEGQCDIRVAMAAT